MIRFSVFALFAFLMAVPIGCRDVGESADTPYTAVDSIPLLIMKIQQCSKLYTTEYHVHKIVTHDDELRLKGTFFDQDFDLPLPLGDRKVVIPMDATLKGYIDFEGFSAEQVRRSDGRITIILPDPRVTMTSSKVDQKNIKEYVSLTRAHFSDKELAAIETMGREAIIASIPELGIVESARASAARLLIPILEQMGFKEGNIEVVFREGFNSRNVKALFDQNTIERNER